MARIGVLALQGGFAPHAEWIDRRGHHPVLVRTAKDMVGLDGMILPGGESSTQLRLLSRAPALAAALHGHVAAGRPLLATCAGLILASREVVGPTQPSLGLVDVRVRRNGWGAQHASGVELADDGVTPVVLIRAPRIEDVGPRVEVLLSLGGEPVLVRDGPTVGATCHPELVDSQAVWDLWFPSSPQSSS